MNGDIQNQLGTKTNSAGWPTNVLLETSGAGVIQQSTVTTTEADYLIGVTSGIQSQINAKLAKTTTASRAIETDGSGNIQASAITSTELGYLNDMNENIRDAIDGRVTYMSMDPSNNIYHVPSGSFQTTGTWKHYESTTMKHYWFSNNTGVANGDKFHMAYYFTSSATDKQLRLSTRVYKTTNRGKLTISYTALEVGDSVVAETADDFTSIGTTDCYDAGQLYNQEIDLKVFNVSASTSYCVIFQFKVDGKNASSTDYKVAFNAPITLALYPELIS